MKRSIMFFVAILFVATCICRVASAEETATATSTATTGNLGFWNNVHSPQDYPAWRTSVLAYYRKVMRIPEDYKALPLGLKYTDTLEVAPGVTRYRIEYNTTDGLRIPAFLFIPKTDKPVPAVIVYHGHGPGKICAAEKEGTNENALARYLAVNLGYVVLAPDSRSFGEFKIPGKNHGEYYNSLIAINRLYMSKLMEDGYQDMALLRSLKQVDMSNVGAAGISMGSWRTLNQAVLHDDIKAAVVAGLYIPWNYLFSMSHCACQHIPRLKMKMRMEDFAATLFPRDLMVQWGLKDGFHAMDAEDLISRTTKITDYLGVTQHFVVDRHPDMGHQFSDPDIAKFMNQRLGDGAWKMKM